MIVPDKEECLARSIKLAAEDYDFIITTGGASNGDYDFIKPVVEDLGDLYMFGNTCRHGIRIAIANAPWTERFFWSQ